MRCFPMDCSTERGQVQNACDLMTKGSNTTNVVQLTGSSELGSTLPCFGDIQAKSLSQRNSVGKNEIFPTDCTTERGDVQNALY